MEQISVLTKHPAYEILIEELEAARERYYSNFAAGLASSPQPIDQREVDYKRGYWAGAIYALKTFPKLTTKDFDKFIAAALEESETN